MHTGRPPASVMIPDAVLYNFDLLMVSTYCSKHVEAYNKLIIKQEKTTMVWPRQKDARGENTKINYGLDTTGEMKKRASKKNVDGRNTSSHDNKKFRIGSLEK